MPNFVNFKPKSLHIFLKNLAKISSLVMFGLLLCSIFFSGMGVIAQSTPLVFEGGRSKVTSGSFKGFLNPGDANYKEGTTFIATATDGTEFFKQLQGNDTYYATGCVSNAGLFSGEASYNCNTIFKSDQVGINTNTPTEADLNNASAKAFSLFGPDITYQPNSEVFIDTAILFSKGLNVDKLCPSSGICTIQKVECSDTTKLCRVKNDDGTYINFANCTNKGVAIAGQGVKGYSCDTILATNEAINKSNLTTLLPSKLINNIVTLSVQDKQDKETVKAISNPIEELVKALMDFISAVLLIFVYLAGWFANIVLYLVALVFLIIIQINPASSTFLEIAKEPWQIVVSIANLLILFSFIYLGFGYLLGIKSIVKNNRWETFVTNILIIGVTVNLSLFATAAFVNFTHGLGDTFIGAYTATAGKSKSEAIIGDFTKSIEQVSYIRCGAVNVTDSKQATTGGEKCDNNPIAQGYRIGTSVGTGLSLNVFGALFGTKAGGVTAITAGEIVYLIVIIYAIMQMWKAMMLALLRVVGLWLLMIASPLALVGFFSPISQLKKLSAQWWENFSSLSFFYPVFIFGLILVGRVSSAFSAAANTNIKALTGSLTDGAGGVLVSAQGTGDATSQLAGTLGLYVAIAFASVYMLGLLTSSFQKILDAIKAGIKSATSAIGGAVGNLGTAARLGARLGGSVAPGLAGKLRLNERVANLKDGARIQSKINEAKKGLNSTDALVRTKAQTTINSLEKQKVRNEARRAKLYGKARSNVQEKFNNWGDWAEDVTNRDWLASPKDLKSKWAADKKARLDGNKAARDFDREVKYRKFGGAEGARLADQDKNAKLRGLNREDILEKEKSDPNWLANQRSAIRKGAYDKSIGTDARVPRSMLASKSLKLADKAKGDINNLNSEEQAAFVDNLKQGIEIGDVRQQFMGDKNMTKLIRGAMDSDRILDEDTKEKIRRKAPIFIANTTERNQKLGEIARNEEMFKEMDGAWLATHPEEAREFLAARSRAVPEKQAIEDIARKAGLRGGFSSFADDITRESTFAKMGINVNDKSQKEVVDKIDLATQQSMGKGLDQNFLVENAIKNNFDKTLYDKSIEDLLTKQMGGKNSAEILDRAKLASNLNVGNTDKELADALKNLAQAKGINVEGMVEADQVKVLQGALARNADNVAQTQDVLFEQHKRIGEKLQKEKQNANVDNVLVSEAKKEANSLASDLQKGIVPANFRDSVEAQAKLEVANNFFAQIKKGSVEVNGVRQNVDFGGEKQEKAYQKDINEWLAKKNAFDPTEWSQIQARYASDPVAFGIINAIGADVATKQGEIANKIQSQAKAKGSGTAATSDQLAEVMRNMADKHGEKIKETNKKAVENSKSLDLDVDRIFGRI